MIIDFRLRPPLYSYKDIPMFTNLANNTATAEGMGMTQAASVAKGSIDLCLMEMERAGIVMGVTSGRTCKNKSDCVPNEDLMKIIQEYPGKFVAFGSLDPSNTQESIDIIDKFVLNGTLSGIILEPGMLNEPMYLDDPRLFPLYDYCTNRQIRVMTLQGGGAGPDISYTNPEHLDRVLAAFPKMRVVAVHGGWPWCDQVISIAYRRQNLWVSADMYMVFPGGKNWFEAANGFMADRFLFGSGYPFLPVEGYLKRFIKYPFKADVLPKLLYQNAQRFLNL